MNDKIIEILKKTEETKDLAAGLQSVGAFENNIDFVIKTNEDLHEQGYNALIWFEKYYTLSAAIISRLYDELQEILNILETIDEL